MASTVKLVLHGHYAKKTVKLRDIQFVRGEAVLPGNYAQNEGIIIYMGRCYQAYPEGMSPQEGEEHASKVPATALGHKTKEIPGAGESTGTKLSPQGPEDGEGDGGAEGGGTGSIPEGNGHEDPRIYTRLQEALNGLDPKNDLHWTQKGLPSLQVLETILGGGGVTRKEIEAAIPGFSREIALGRPSDPAPQGETENQQQ